MNFSSANAFNIDRFKISSFWYRVNVHRYLSKGYSRHFNDRADKDQNEQNMQLRNGSTLFHINDLRICSWEHQIVTVWLTVCSTLAMISYTLCVKLHRSVPKRQIVRLVQIESICRRQIKLVTRIFFFTHSVFQSLLL